MVSSILHLAIIVSVGLSLERAELRFQVTGGSGAVLASLTPASVLDGAAAKLASDRLDRMAANLTNPVPPADRPASHSQGAEVLADLDEAASPPLQTASHHSAATPSASSPAALSSALRAGDSPWSHASASTLNTSKVYELWAAISPCWRGHVDEGVASIRVVLNARGEVSDMSTLNDSSGSARSAAEALAAAVGACAPYRVGAADAYLVTGPV